MAMSGETMQVSDAEYAHAVETDRYHRNRLLIAIALLKSHTNLRDKTIFDFGCGEGTLMRMLSAEGADVSGSDISQSLIDKAPEKAAVGSVETLEALPTKSIDVLIVLNVLGYVPTDQQARFWPAAAHALKFGGLMLQANSNSDVAAGTGYFFRASPRTFPDVLADHDFSEIAQDFHRYRLNALLRPIFGRDLLNHNLQAVIPKSIRAKRSTVYYSLSRRT